MLQRVAVLSAMVIVRTSESGARPPSQLVAHVGAEPVRGIRCVELYCGSGVSSAFLAMAGAARVVGVDHDARYIESADARAAALPAAASAALRFVVGDALGSPAELALPELASDGQFDLVLDSQAFERGRRR